MQHRFSKFIVKDFRRGEARQGEVSAGVHTPMRRHQSAPKCREQGTSDWTGSPQLTPSYLYFGDKRTFQHSVTRKNISAVSVRKNNSAVSDEKE